MLKIRHNAGFFSCCNIVLLTVIGYFNKEEKLPIDIDCSQTFNKYKKDEDKNTDVTDHFFSYNEEIEINFNKPIVITTENREDQFSNYKLLNISDIHPFIRKYFSPSPEIINIKTDLLKKYNVDMNRCISVYYRGTDKLRETQLGDFNKYYDKIASLKNDDSQIMIQTDTKPFLDYMKSKYPDCICFDENKVSNKIYGIHNENTNNVNYNDIKYLFATFLIMAESKHLVMSSGNCSLWMTYYRGHVDNIYQCLHNSFLQ